ncbi:uncharacterized protein V6R79_015176 [Siganus canaliculatus]
MQSVCDVEPICSDQMQSRGSDSEAWKIQMSSCETCFSFSSMQVCDCVKEEEELEAAEPPELSGLVAPAPLLLSWGKRGVFGPQRTNYPAAELPRSQTGNSPSAARIKRQTTASNGDKQGRPPVSSLDGHRVALRHQHVRCVPHTEQ